MPIQRDERIDSLRGLFLVVMTIDHFKGLLWRFVYQSPGFVSSAEGFAFISGFYFAMVYLRYVNEPGKLIQAAGKRAFLIYKYNMAILFGLIAMTYLVPMYQAYWAEWLRSFHQNPVRSIVADLLLLQTPNWLDVFSMFIFFVLSAPLSLLLFHKNKGWIVLLLSLFFWGLGQFGYSVAAITKMFFPEAQPGYFNLFAWQLIWHLGLFFGYRAARGFKNAWLDSKFILAAAAGLASYLFLTRHGMLATPFDVTSHLKVTDLGPLRVLNFCALAVLIRAVLRYIPPDRGLPWFSFLGKHSLQVFAYQLVLMYLLMPFNERIIQAAGLTGHTFYVLGMTATLTFPAFWHARVRNGKLVGEVPFW
ncbi:MAG: hypothetical protein A2Y02_02595 [Omnitrophica bacterium GWA2_52_12]|nr:MAG: hypothetical protein A2Y02_02595 [Omnitrophica bacterium GWA2_52_12]